MPARHVSADMLAYCGDVSIMKISMWAYSKGTYICSGLRLVSFSFYRSPNDPALAAYTGEMPNGQG
jgi:hypothetical protein